MSEQNDLISRQAAIDVIEKGRLTKLIDAEVARIGIEQLPPAQPQRIHGRWINGKCDKCGGHAPFWSMASTYYLSDFCQNCGADMREESNETD